MKRYYIQNYPDVQLIEHRAGSLVKYSDLPLGDDDAVTAHAPKQELNMNVIKSLIVDRLYDREGICSCCGKKGKGHGNYHLPSRLPLESVLKAINLDEYYFKELYSDNYDAKKHQEIYP